MLKVIQDDFAFKSPGLQDSFGRTFTYLRLSLTDICNFRCQYCLPNGYKKTEKTKADGPLSAYEIENLVCGFSELGFTKVRLTGGEPTVRGDLLEIVSRIRKEERIKTLAITTNGYRLEYIADDIFSAGVNAINISIDSLTADGFKKITGHDRLESLLRGLDRLLELGMKKVKVNVVVMKTFNHQALSEFEKWVRDKPVTVRFIELMETGDNRKFFENEHVSGDLVRDWLLERGWSRQGRLADSGPAEEYSHSGSLGKLGVIAPYTKDFCSNCNRLRVSSRGALRLCLFGDGEISLRPYLQDVSQREALIERVQNLLVLKKPTHYLHERNVGMTSDLAAIGG